MPDVAASDAAGRPGGQILVAPAPEGVENELLQIRRALLASQEHVHQARNALEAQLAIATQLARRCEELERWKKQVLNAFHEVRGLLS